MDEFNQVVSVVIIQSGGNFQGLFVYSPTPGAGNLVASIAATAGTDPYGNAYLAGEVNYVSVTGLTANSNGTYAIVSGLDAAGRAGIEVANQTHASFLPPGYFAQAGTTDGTETVISSGLGQNTNTGCSVTLEDSGHSGIAGGSIGLNAGQVILGQAASALWSDITSQLSLPADGGPFISGEGFHAISAASGTTGLLSGGNGMRVKKLPWNAIWMDIEFQNSSANTGGLTFTFGSLPDATYYPNVTRHFPMSITGNISVAGAIAFPRVFVPTSGAIQVVVPTQSASGTYICSGSIMYPTN